MKKIRKRLPKVPHKHKGNAIQSSIPMLTLNSCETSMNQAISQFYLPSILSSDADELHNLDRFWL